MSSLHNQAIVCRFRPFTVQDLTALAEHLVSQHPDWSQARLAYGLAQGVIGWFLDTEWLQHHIVDAKPGSYFHTDKGTHVGWNLHLARVCELGENLFNLQRVPGVIAPEYQSRSVDFDFISKRLKDDAFGSKIEEVCNELAGIKLLVLNGIPVALIHEWLGNGSNFDVAITLPSGKPGCLELKCKLSTVELSSKSLLNQLKKAAKQLPPDSCGGIMIKIPVVWTEQEGWSVLVDSAIEKLFRDTQRVAEVLYYVETFYYNPEKSGLTLGFYRRVNQRSRFIDHLGGQSFLTPQNSALGKDWLNFRQISLEQLRSLAGAAEKPADPA